MTSPADTDEGMERLVSALEEIDGELAKRDKYERNNSLARYIVQDSDTYQYILKDKKERDHQKNIYIYSPVSYTHLDIVTIEPGAFAGKVTKVLKGNRDTGLAAGEFNFQMKITPADDTSSMDNVVLPEGAVGDTITSANAADGSVSFGNIQFKAAGNYHVEITEVVPEYADPNMTYDKHTFSLSLIHI